LQAVRCAIEIRAWTESYRRRETPASIGFGRTRVGIETGQAIVGDIGLRSKLDYTAHGDAVNSAARFEAANKELGSAICVGPGTAARCDRALFRPTGVLVLRGFTETVPTCEPWPEDADEAWRSRYLEAVELAATDTVAAARRLTELAAERPHDPLPLNFARRLTEQTSFSVGSSG
jgi:adenylate cyclase